MAGVRSYVGHQGSQIELHLCEKDYFISELCSWPLDKLDPHSPCRLLSYPGPPQDYQLLLSFPLKSTQHTMARGIFLKYTLDCITPLFKTLR